MAASQGDIIQITDVQVQKGQQVLNVYNYEVVTLTGLADNYLEVIADWYEEVGLAAVRGIQSSSLVHIGLRVINYTTGIDFLERPLANLAGVRPAPVLPPNVCWTFRLLRETRATRHGWKRYAGVAEQDQNNGDNEGLGAAQLDPVLNFLAADFQPAPSVVPLLAPVIVRKNALGEVVAKNNIGAAEYRHIGTQNTRKIGRGS